MSNKDISRRDFLKIVGAGSLASAAALYGCSPKEQTSTVDKSLQEVPTDKMTFRTNRHTGDKVSLLGYGCMRFSMMTNANGEEEIDQEKVNQLVDYAIAHGVNYFDTSPRYLRGMSEKATGIALSRHSRDKYFIATKMSNQAEEIHPREKSIAMYHKSMEDLQVDYLDYYLLHSIGGGANGMETFNSRFIDNGILDFLLKEKEAGRIRNLGWSYHGDVAVFDHLLAMDIQWDFAMIQHNYVDWKHASERNTNSEYLYGELLKHNVPAVIMEPLLGGRLARLTPQAMSILKQMRPQDSAADWAFRYAGTLDNVLTVLSGMNEMEHLQENVLVHSPFEPLSEAENKALEEVTEIILRSDLIQCTECQYCMPCPYGLDIPGIFMHYNRCVTEENILESSQDESYRKARREFLISYDRSVPKLRQAKHCIGCNKCIPKCPQKINISEELIRIDQYVEKLKQGIEF